MENLHEESDVFFFWLSQDGQLDRVFFAASEEFQKQGIKLLPVKFDQVAKLASLTDSKHVVVICSTRNTAQYQSFQKEIAPTLGLLLKQERLSFFHLSSFKKLDFTNKVKRKSYLFLKFPLKLETVCAKIVLFHQYKETQAARWPGGRRAKVPGLSA